MVPHTLNGSKSVVLLFCAFFAPYAATSASAQTTPFGSEAQQHAETLLKQMTVDEKVGQLNQAAGVKLTGLSSEKPDELIAKEESALFSG